MHGNKKIILPQDSTAMGLAVIGELSRPRASEVHRICGEEQGVI